MTLGVGLEYVGCLRWKVEVNFFIVPFRMLSSMMVYTSMRHLKVSTQEYSMRSKHSDMRFLTMILTFSSSYERLIILDALLLQ